MSKRPSNVQSTLLNFFTKSPSTSQTNGHAKPKSNPPTPNGTPKRIKKEKKQPNRSPVRDEDEEIVAPKKRRRIIVNDDSSDTDSDYVPDSVRSDNSSTPSTKPLLSKFNFDSPSVKLPKLEKPSFDEQAGDSDSESDNNNRWAHESFQFLHPDHIRDARGNRPNSDKYNPRTLYVPDDFLKSQTPAMRQWWTLKKENFDCVLFFKVGKFYELYHMDAIVGVQYLGFSFMKGDFAHSGFPEIGYGRFSSILVDLGFKVARVEQTETPEMLAERKKTASKNDQSVKVVTREICQVTTKGVKIQAIQDTQIKKAMGQYLLALNEHRCKNDIEFGVCFIDTSIGTVHVGQFRDTVELTKLVALIAEYTPVAILEEKGNLSRLTKRLFKSHLEGVKYETLDSEYEFPQPEKVVQNFLKQNYFENFPNAIKDLFENENIRSPYKQKTKLALRCLGAVQYFLQNCLLDIQIFSMGNIVKYIPPSDSSMVNKCMLLDGSTLQNLHLLGGPGSLQYNLDRCCTPMGKRLLKQWICHPLCDITSIEERLSAISEIRVSQSLNETREALRTLPDLERCLAQIHSFGNKLKSEKHPDSRAIFYEEKIYSKKKVQHFISLINAFKNCINLIKQINTQVKKSTLIQYYTSFESEGGCFPDILDILKYFEDAFDHEKALKDGVIIPQDGMDEEYDNSKKEISYVQKAANRYLEQFEKLLGCKLTFFGRDKKRFQLEVPDRHCHKLPDEFVLEGQKKGVCKRFYSPELKEFLVDIMKAEKRNRDLLLDLNRRIFYKFAEKFELWSKAINCIATLDVLFGISLYIENQNVEMTKPIFSNSTQPKLVIKEGVHPFIPIDNFVPNDTILGDSKAPILILSGPNMGGKSTLMRQVGIIAIMAQLGLYIPAQYCEMTVIDKIFTRLGARDDIMAGSSTFDVELRESLAILNSATSKSLVLLDELGRGTSTYDGTAIAASYVNSLTKIGCRTIFSTHYSHIIDLYNTNPVIQMGHMACKVEKLKDDIKFDDITFTYKLVPGGCDKSYGLNAARLGGIYSSVCERALEIANQIEVMSTVKILCESIVEEDCDMIRNHLKSLSIET